MTDWLPYAAAALVAFLVLLAWQVDRIERAVGRVTDLLMSLEEVRKAEAERVEFERLSKLRSSSEPPLNSQASASAQE